MVTANSDREASNVSERASIDRPGAAQVESAARLVIAHGFADDDSAFTPGRAIWTASHANALVESFVNKPDTGDGGFMTKLLAQLAGAPSESYQLMAELLYLNVLPLTDYYGNTKREQVKKLLERCDEPVEIPDRLSTALDGGVFNGGIGFKTGRWQQLSFLVQLVQFWKSQPPASRAAAPNDPWTFRDLIMSAPGPKVPAQRNALLYLAFPTTFLPIASVDQKKKIRAAFLEYIDVESSDIDRDLAQIKAAAEAESGSPVDFYLEPWISRWRPPKTEADPESKPPADETMRRAWLIRGANVNGRNLIPVWLSDGLCSLAASHLRPIDATIKQDDLRTVLDEDYAHVSYNARAEKVAEIDAFLNRMDIGDLILTTSEGKIFVGKIIGPALYVKSADHRSNLQRKVAWQNVDAPMDFSDLPAALQAMFSSQHTVVDLTSELSALEKLIALFTHTVTDAAPGTTAVAEARLADATQALADELLVDFDWLQECIELLRDRPQLILYGPPGTGKTYLAQRIAEHLAGRDGVKLVQFHPAYSYEDFFEGYRPVAAADGSASVGFRLTPGPFRRLVDSARENPGTAYVLIIDEINRANLPKVFGELYFLLEYRDRAIDLLYSAGDHAGFTLPPNVFLIATMNTADRSIALVDAAMRRRFAFLELHPSQPPTAGVLVRWLAREGYPPTNAAVLDRLNSLIEDKDFQIGPSYFMRDTVYQPGGLDRVWRTSILPLLEEHHYGESIDVSKRYALSRIMQHIDASDTTPTSNSEAPVDG